MDDKLFQKFRVKTLLRMISFSRGETYTHYLLYTSWSIKSLVFKYVFLLTLNELVRGSGRGV